MGGGALGFLVGFEPIHDFRFFTTLCGCEIATDFGKELEARKSGPSAKLTQRNGYRH